MYSRDFPRLHDVGVTKNSIGYGNGGERAQQPGIEIMSRQAHWLGGLPQQAHERIEQLALRWIVWPNRTKAATGSP